MHRLLLRVRKAKKGIMITRTVPVIYYGVFSTVPVRFLGCPFTLTIIQAYAPTINAEEEISVQVEIY